MTAALEPWTGDNRLPTLAGEIEAAHQRCKARVSDAIKAAVEAGRRLIEAKELIGHGEWEAWLTANVPTVSARTCRRYMRMARNAGETDTVSISTFRDLIKPERREAEESKANRELAELVGGCLHGDEDVSWHHHGVGSSGHCRRCGYALFLPIRELNRTWKVAAAAFGPADLADIDVAELATAFEAPRRGGGAWDWEDAAGRIRDSIADMFNGLCTMVLHARRARELLEREQWHALSKAEFGAAWEPDGEPDGAP